MKPTLVCILLAFVSALTLGLLQDHYFINQKKTWFEAQDYCRQHYSNLSSIRNQEENNLLKNERGSDEESWIGYVRDFLSKFGSWSDGTESLYTNWAQSEPDTAGGYCVAMKRRGRWKDDLCSESKTFFCSWWHRELVLVTERLTWEEALLHCRERYTDLASVLTPEEATHLAGGKPVENRTTEQVWTSLRYLAGQWLWVSERHAATQSQKEFTQGSLPSCPAEPYSCGARVPGRGLWENRDCQERLNFLCYRAGPDG